MEVVNKERRNKLYNDVNDAICKAANEAGITPEQAYNFMLAFADTKEDNNSFRDKNSIIKYLNEIIKGYDTARRYLDTTDIHSVETHKFLSGKILGIKDAIKAIEEIVD